MLIGYVLIPVTIEGTLFEKLNYFWLRIIKALLEHLKVREAPINTNIPITGSILLFLDVLYDFGSVDPLNFFLMYFIIELCHKMT